MAIKQKNSLYINYQNILFGSIFFMGFAKAIINSYFFNFDFTVFIMSLISIDIGFNLLLRFTKLTLNIKALIPSLLILSFYLVMIISLSYTKSESYGFYKTLYFFPNVIFFFYPFFMLEFRLGVLKKMLKFIIIPISLWFIYARYQYWLPESEPIRLAKEGFYNIDGIYLPLGASLGIYILSQLFEEKKSWFFIIILLLIMLALGSRGSFLFVIITTLILKHKSIIERVLKFKLKRKVINLILLLIIIMPVLIYKFQALFTKFLFYGLYRIGSLLNFGKDTSSLGRIDRMLFSLENSFGSITSFLFGNGIGSYGFLYLRKDVREYPHNIVLETLSELGIFATIIIIVFLIYPFFLRRLNIIVLSFLLFMLLDSLKSGNLTDLWVLFSIYGLAVFTNVKQINNWSNTI